MVGVGRGPFIAPQPEVSAAVLGAQAACAALMDASLHGSLVQQAFIASAVQGEESVSAVACAAQMAGIAPFKVSSGYTGGAHALYRAREAVTSGAVDCALVLGVHAGASCSKQGAMQAAAAAGACVRFCGTRNDTFARISAKARQHAARNPLVSQRCAPGLTEIMASGAHTSLQCSTHCAGAAAVVLCTTAFAHLHRLDKRVVVAAQEFERSLDGDDVQRATERAALKVYAQSGVRPEHIDLVELHDDFVSSELQAYEALHLIPKGDGDRFVLEGENTYGGLVVTNPSGGLLGQGNAGAANALAQCAEVVWQLRGAARQRQVEGARLALQHCVDPESGMCVVTLYRVEAS